MVAKLEVIRFIDRATRLRQALGDDQVFDKPSELRAKTNTSQTELVETPTEKEELVN